MISSNTMNIAKAEEMDCVDEMKPYTVQDFMAYMQHGYQKYNIFWVRNEDKESFFVSDKYYEYRQINTDTVDVNGKIAVICQMENNEDSEQIENESNQDMEDDNESEGNEAFKENDITDYAQIAYQIEQDESYCIRRIYTGSRLPEELSLTFINADTLKLSDLEGYDLYIFEESSKYADISEEVFLHLDDMLKKDKDTIVYDMGIVSDTWGTGEEDGSNVIVIQNSDEDEYTTLISGNSGLYLVGIKDKIHPVAYHTGPKYKDFVQTDIMKNGYRCSWRSYMEYEQRLSQGILLYNAYTTIKVLPTYTDDKLKNVFYDSRTGGPYEGFRYTKRIVLPASITSISDQTFCNYDVLTDINLGNITTIGDSAFLGCKSLQRVRFSEDADVSIGDSAFEGCGLTNIKIPDNVKSIGTKAFADNYVTDPLSLEHNATSWEKCIEYRLYMESHTEDLEKEPSIENVDIAVSDDGLDLQPDVFSVDDMCQIHILHKNDTRESLFEFTNQSNEKWEDSCILPEQLNSLKHIAYLRPAQDYTDNDETDDDNENVENENTHTVTLVDPASILPYYRIIEVDNGEQWEEYLPSMWNLSCKHMDLQYTFNGWETGEGQIIDNKSTVQLQSDISLYTKYTLSGKDAKTNFKLIFYGTNKTIKVKMGKKFYDYDIPTQSRKGDEFLGWSYIYPVLSVNDIISKETTITPLMFGNKTELTLYPVFQSDVNDKHLITTTEVLSGEPIYRLNENNIGNIKNYDDNCRYKLDKKAFNDSDKRNAENIKNKILKAGKNKIAILPKGYKVNIDKLKKSGYNVIKTNLELDDYISALTYINCRYFQYLQLVQTPYFKTEKELKKWDKDKDEVGYNLCVSDFELSDSPAYCNGFIYFVNRDKFKNYYNICHKMEVELINIGKAINLHKDMVITDAIWTVNELLIKDYAYDNWVQIYDLNWFLKITDEKRNKAKKADYHGVCASYSKLAYALLGLYGYEAIPTAVGDGNDMTHSVSRMKVNGKVYYCDYTWSYSGSPERYMFLTTDNMIFNDHRKPEPDDMGHKITYNRQSTTLSSPQIKSVKNQKGRKITVTYNKINNAKGYEIQYSTNGNFKSAKKKSVSKTKVVINKLKKNKTYYVRVRPYKMVKLYSLSNRKNQTIKYYGAWSKTKKVKIKK
ncbi:MAG: leucine-rich repeat protein [Lachnospiraceae bacterium]|nr:leucine-rich repeat protein [Lachnospiraceae bacterium]